MILYFDNCLTHGAGNVYLRTHYELYTFQNCLNKNLVSKKILAL